MWPFKTLEEEIVLLLDIGSGSVGGALVLLAKGKQPRILYTVRIPLEVREKPSSEKLLDDVLKYLDKVLEAVHNEGGARLNFLKINHKKTAQTLCFFTSPWHISQTKILKFEKPEPFVVTKKFLNDLVEKEIKQFESGGTSGVPGVNGYEIIEKKIIQTKLNGYETANPYGKKVKSFEVSMYVGLVLKDAALGVKKIVENHYWHRPIIFHTFPLVSCNTVNDIFSDKTNFLYIDVTGEITDLSLVRQNVILESVSFPSGRHTLIRKIMEKFKVSSEIAISFVNLYQSGRADEQLKTDVELVVKSIRDEWVSYFNSILEDLKKISPIPETIFFTALPDVVKIFSLFPGTNTEEKYFPIVISEENISHFVNFSDKVVRDPFLALEGVFANKLFQHS